VAITGTGFVTGTTDTPSTSVPPPDLGELLDHHRLFGHLGARFVRHCRHHATTVDGTSTPSAADEFEYGTFAYVANFGDSTVSVIDTATQAVITTIRWARTPMALPVTPNGLFPT